MSTLRAKQTLRKNLTFAWTELTASVNQIAAGCDVRPNQADGMFQVDQGDDNSIKVEFLPVAFLLKEKAQSDKSELFVTVKGRVNFTLGTTDPMLACFFSTEVGYFRKTSGSKLEHTLGIHYDHDDKITGHPVYHAQLTSCRDHLNIINRHYRPTFELVQDRMEFVARKVRLPTAHMDPLAVFVQLLADHLINMNSGPNETAAFERARNALMFFKGDPARARRLDEVRDEHCFRGPRWYLKPTVGTAADAVSAAPPAQP